MGDNGTDTIDCHPQKALGLKPRRDARALTRKALESIRFDTLDGGLENAMEQHSLALSSSDPKASLVNLWAALECLVGAEGPNSNLERVIYWIAPIVALRRIDKITRYLSVCSHIAYRAMSQEPDTTLFTRSSRYRLSARDVFEALASEECNPRILKLLNDHGKHPLLRHRLYQAWERIHDPQTVALHLEQSHQRLRWHLARIYRARNLTVHQGKTPAYSTELVDNLQYYFSRCVSRVLSDLKQHSDWSVGTALQNHRQRYLYVVQALRKAPGDVPGEYLFPQDDEFLDYSPWSAIA